MLGGRVGLEASSSKDEQSLELGEVLTEEPTSVNWTRR